MKKWWRNTESYPLCGQGYLNLGLTSGANFQISCDNVNPPPDDGRQAGAAVGRIGGLRYRN